MALFDFYSNEDVTPETLRRRRALAEQMLGSVGGGANSIGEGLAQLGRAIGGRIALGRVNRLEKQKTGGAYDWFGGLVQDGNAAAPSVTAAPVKISGNRQGFVDSIMPAALEASKATGIDPRIIVAQAAHESGWGQHAPGNNLFGIKSHGQAGGNVFSTTEVVNGKPVTVRDSFRAYDNPAASVAGYADFINSNPRYKGLKGAKGLDAQLAALQASGYATDPNYGTLVGNIARGISMPAGAGELSNADYLGQFRDAVPPAAAKFAPGFVAPFLQGPQITPAAAPPPAPSAVPQEAPPMRPMSAFERMVRTQLDRGTISEPRPGYTAQQMGWNPFAALATSRPAAGPVAGPSAPAMQPPAMDAAPPQDAPVAATTGQQMPVQQDQGSAKWAAAIASPQFKWLDDASKRIILENYQMEREREAKAADPAAALDLEYRKAQIEKMQAEIKQAASPDARKNYGLTPQYGVDANGNPVLLQLGSDATAEATKMPEGVTLSKAPIKLDAGTHYILLDPITRQPVGQIPKDLAGAEEAKAMGSARGAAKVELGPAVVDAGRTIQKINELLDDPGLASATGWQGNIPDGLMPFVPGAGQSGLTARTKINQLHGRAFMDAYATLKGGGQITEVEGRKATDALARLNDPRISDADYRTALIDFRDAVQIGIEKLAARAGTSAPAISDMPQSRGAPQPNTGTPNSGGDDYREGDVVQNSKGERLILRNSQWVPYDGQ